MEQGRRIELIDGIRGISLCFMMGQHFVYDLCAFCGLPWSLFYSPVCNAIHYVFGTAFILLSGICANFTRSNVRRGLRALGVAMVITVVTYLMDMVIVYGVLHLLGTCMVLYGLTRRFWEKLPDRVLPVLSVLGFLVTLPLINGFQVSIPHLWIFGLVTPDFYSSDYFPLLPWSFVFLLGAWMGRHIRAGELPGWFYEAKAPFFAPMGRKSLLIYVAHQPVLYAVTMLVKLVMG